MDRHTLIAGIGLITGALIVFAIGVTGIFLALNDDGADLPDEGSITEIAEENASPTSTGTVPATAQPDGPPPPAPTRLGIPGLYIDAPVIVLGLTPDNHPDVPKRPDQVAWYPSFSTAPGQSSNAVFAGHVDWQTEAGAPIPGVFYRLREMEIGDFIEVTLEDGQKLEYRVRANVAAVYDDPKIVQVMQPTNKDVITIITCGGAWVKDGRQPNGGNYSHRVIVRAERVHALAGNLGQ
jgi:LPXTG-site transpeptidase (sortase) family protein